VAWQGDWSAAPDCLGAATVLGLSQSVKTVTFDLDSGARDGADDEGAVELEVGDAHLRARDDQRRARRDPPPFHLSDTQVYEP